MKTKSPFMSFLFQCRSFCAFSVTNALTCLQAGRSVRDGQIESYIGIMLPRFTLWTRPRAMCDLRCSRRSPSRYQLDGFEMSYNTTHSN